MWKTKSATRTAATTRTSTAIANTREAIAATDHFSDRRGPSVARYYTEPGAALAVG